MGIFRFLGSLHTEKAWKPTASQLDRFLFLSLRSRCHNFVIPYYVRVLKVKVCCPRKRETRSKCNPRDSLQPGNLVASICCSLSKSDGQGVRLSRTSMSGKHLHVKGLLRLFNICMHWRGLFHFKANSYETQYQVTN